MKLFNTNPGYGFGNISVKDTIDTINARRQNGYKGVNKTISRKYVVGKWLLITDNIDDIYKENLL